jgi:hypothetical protein
MTTKERRRKIRCPNKRKSIRNQLVAMYGRSCWLCGRGIADGDVISIDHVRPLAKGGSNKIHNLRPAHDRCNRERGCNGVPVLLLTSDMMLNEKELGTGTHLRALSSAETCSAGQNNC